MIRQTTPHATPHATDRRRVMPVYLPQQQALSARLAQPHQGLVICFCAAWCDTCRGYHTALATLADAYPQHVFIWADIEDHPELLGETDVENFPTLLVISGAAPRFFGPLLPHIGHLQRLLAVLINNVAAPAVVTTLPDDLPALLTGRANRLS